MYQPTRRQVLIGGAGAAAALALSSCGSDNGSSKKDSQDLSKNRVGAMKDYGAGTQFKATEPLTFSIMMLSNPGYPYKKSWPFWSELEKLTNISFDPTVVPISDYNQKRSVMINAGTQPTIIPKTYPPDEEQYVAGGAILPVSDYVDLMPNYQDKVKKWNLQADIDTLRQADGKYYLLPGLHEDLWKDYTLAVRTDVLDRAGVAMPKTWDDVHAMLKAMRPLLPDGQYPFSDRWSIPPLPGGGANALLEILGNSYGTWGGWEYRNYWWDSDQGKFVFSGAMDEYKQLLQYLNSLVSEKLLDPESFTQTDDAAEAKFAQGKSFVISTNAQELVNTYRKGIAKIPGATVAKMPVPLGPMGPVKVGTRLENGLMISSKARDSENFVAMMQLIDWLWYSDAGEVFAKWGIKGTTYTGDVDAGTFKLAPNVDWAGLNPKAKKELNVDYGFFNGVFAYGGSTRLLDTQFTPEELAFQKVMNTRKDLPVPPPHPLSSDEREQASLWESALTDYVDRNTLDFALGKRALSEWDSYVSELKGKSMDQYIDLINKAYDRYHKNH